MLIDSMVDVILIVASLIVAVGMFWKASREQRAIHVIGALGWVIFALSGVTDGLFEIALTGVALVIFIFVVFVHRRNTTSKDAEAV